MASNKFIKCSGCDALVMDIAGPVHKYIGAVAGCWNIYGKVLNREYGEYNYPDIHRLTVDAYSVQHPGNESHLTTQSVAVHLLGLYFSLVESLSGNSKLELIKMAMLQKEKFYWLTPPDFPGKLTIVDVYKTKNIQDHEKLVNLWAADVWNSWSEHHQVVKNWARDL